MLKLSGWHRQSIKQHLPFVWTLKTSVYDLYSGLSENSKDCFTKASRIASLPLSTTVYLTFKHTKWFHHSCKCNKNTRIQLPDRQIRACIHHVHKWHDCTWPLRDHWGWTQYGWLSLKCRPSIAVSISYDSCTAYRGHFPLKPDVHWSQHSLPAKSTTGMLLCTARQQQLLTDCP